MNAVSHIRRGMRTATYALSTGAATFYAQGSHLRAMDYGGTVALEVDGGAAMGAVTVPVRNDDGVEGYLEPGVVITIDGQDYTVSETSQVIGEGLALTIAAPGLVALVADGAEVTIAASSAAVSKSAPIDISELSPELAEKGITFAFQIYEGDEPWTLQTGIRAAKDGRTGIVKNVDRPVGLVYVYCGEGT